MTHYQQSFDFNVGLQRLVLNFVGDKRQFPFLKTIYDSYNIEFSTQKIKSLKIGNASSTYMLTIEIKYDVGDAEDAYWLYAQFVTFVCNGCTIEPLTDYANNLTFQDMTKADKYFSSDEKMYLDLRRSKGYINELESLTRDDSKLSLTVTLKDAANKKMMIRVTGCSQGEYYYILSQRGSIIQYKSYGITKDKKNIAAYKDTKRKMVRRIRKKQYKWSKKTPARRVFKLIWIFLREKRHSKSSYKRSRCIST